MILTENSKSEKLEDADQASSTSLDFLDSKTQELAEQEGESSSSEVKNST